MLKSSALKKTLHVFFLNADILEPFVFSKVFATLFCFLPLEKQRTSSCLNFKVRVDLSKNETATDRFSPSPSGLEGRFFSIV